MVTYIKPEQNYTNKNANRGGEGRKVKIMKLIIFLISKSKKMVYKNQS